LQAEPDVHWTGEFFNGFAKPSFATSTREGGRLPHYQMMAEARRTYPHAWNLLRDAYLAGFEYQYNPFKAYPNLVRERETRRITAIDARDNGVLLTVEDFFGHEQYGIASDRPLSADYKPGDQILVADGIQSARGTVAAVDDRLAPCLLDGLDQPDEPWQLEYPRPLPTTEDPHSPGLFPPGGTYLRKFDPPGTAHYYWGRVHHEWDLLVKQFGFRVIPRFAGAPGDLSIDGRGGTTAKCLVQLHEVTREITSHLIQRYGRATLDWPWVVLNEPDLMTSTGATATGKNSSGSTITRPTPSSARSRITDTIRTRCRSAAGTGRHRGLEHAAGSLPDARFAQRHRRGRAGEERRLCRSASGRAGVRGASRRCAKLTKAVARRSISFRSIPTTTRNWRPLN
jgi:hypothetical protein